MQCTASQSVVFWIWGKSVSHQECFNNSESGYGTYQIKEEKEGNSIFSHRSRNHKQNLCISSIALGEKQIKQNSKTPMLAQTKAQRLTPLYQKSNTRTIPSLHASLATPCCWKISNTDSPLNYFWDTSLYITNGVSLARITKDFVWNQKLASSCSEWQKTRLYPPRVWDFAKAHNCQSTHHPVMKRSSIETQVLFCYLTAKSGMSLNNIEIASANTYKNEIKSESFY